MVQVPTRDLPRRRLVEAAEAVMDRSFSRGTSPAEKSQLSQLVNVAADAGCALEIANYLRYQASRGSGKKKLWEPESAKDVIESIDKILGDLSDDDALEVAAWRLYATYLRRAHAYREAVAQSKQPKPSGGA